MGGNPSEHPTDTGPLTVVSPILLSWCSSIWALKGCHDYDPKVAQLPLELGADFGITHMVMVLQSYKSYKGYSRNSHLDFFMGGLGMQTRSGSYSQPGR